MEQEIYKEILTQADLKEELDKAKPFKKYYWLEDIEWASRKKSKHKEYLERLRSKLQRFLYSKPIRLKVVDRIDFTNSLDFYIGDNVKIYKIDPHLSEHDFCHRLEREFLKPHYPMYKVKEVVTRSPSDYEIREMVFKEGMTFIDAKNQVIKSEREEVGVIDYVEMKNDRFGITVNGHASVRTPGKLYPPRHMWLRDFLYNLKELKDDQEIKNYIFENSDEVRDAIRPKTINIEYEDPLMLINFFREQSYDLYNELVYENEDGEDWVTWGRFRIYIPDEHVKEECKEVVKTMKKKLQRGERV